MACSSILASNRGVVDVNLRLTRNDVQITMMYYWIVKHDGSEDQDIISYKEDLMTLRQHHIIVESLSPFLNTASFALGRRICTEKTWRDLNDTLVTHLQSQHGQDENRTALGVNIGASDTVWPWANLTQPFFSGTIVAFTGMPAVSKVSLSSKSRGGIF